MSKAATTNPAAASAQQHQETNWRYLLPRQAIAMFAAGAVLGPFCDALHSQHDVLHYVHPSVSLQLDSPVHWSFETCWWVAARQTSSSADVACIHHLAALACICC